MRKGRLSQHKQNKLIELFVAGVTARTAAELVNVNKTTTDYYFHRLRLLIYQNSPHIEMFEGEIETDESYFGDTCKGKQLWVKPPYSGFQASHQSQHPLHRKTKPYKTELKIFETKPNVIHISLTVFPKHILSRI